jgi:AcrR family transcriptional regulator
MSINDNDSRVRRTKKLIRQGLTELAKEKSITKITVKELTDLIEINRGTFYLHYKDIFDLVECLEAELYQEFEEIISSITIEAIKHSPIDVLEKVCIFVKKNSDLVGTLVGEHGDAQFVNKIGDLTNKTVLTLFEEVYPNMNRQRYDFAYEYCKYGTMGLIYAWLTKHPETPTRTVAEMWSRLLSQGILGVISIRSAKESTK